MSVKYFPRLQETHFWWIYPRLENNVFHVQCWISKASPNQMAIWLSQQREVRWNSVNHEKMSVSHSYWRHVKKIHISIVISSFIIIQKEREKGKIHVSLTDFFLSEVSSSKCIHSAYLMPSTKKLTFQKVPLFKRILFV